MTKGHVSELQAVVLCGPGHRLSPLVDEEKLPKCLLPIANRPMIYYPLTMLFQAGITDVFVVAHSAGGQWLQNYLTRVYDGGRTHLLLLEEYRGTVDALLAVKSRLHSDFIVVGCDLITDFPISRLVQRSRMSDAAAISLLATPLAMNFMQQVKESTEPKHRLSEEERIVVGLDAEGKRLLSWIPRESIEEGNLKVPMALLTRYPHLRLLTDLHDMHCYVLRRTLLDREEVLRKSSFSIREEIVPDLVRRQFGTEDNYTCEAIIADTGHCVRANSLSSLAECGKQLVRMTGAAGGRLISQAAEVGAKTQIGNDSMIGDHSKIGEKSSVKRSVVGKHCQIGNNVKVSNSVIMDYAVVEDGCRVEGSTIGLKVVVREKSYLKDCDVGPDHVVEAESRNCALQLVYF